MVVNNSCQLSRLCSRWVEVYDLYTVANDYEMLNLTFGSYICSNLEQIWISLFAWKNGSFTMYLSYFFSFHLFHLFIYCFCLIGHPKAMSVSNHAQQKDFCWQKTGVNSRYFWSRPPQLSSGETDMGPELELQWTLLPSP